MSRKISNYFQVKSKDNVGKNVVVAFSPTGTSDFVEDGDGDAKANMTTELLENQARREIQQEVQ